MAVTTTGTPLAGKMVSAVSAGNVHSLALCSDGTLASWGYNLYGQLGNNTTTNSSVPVAVTTTGTPLAGKSVVVIASGTYHSMALCSDGTLATWGYNLYGQLGNNTTTNSSVPVAVTTTGTPLAGKTVVSMAAGGYHNLALCSDGTLVAWGENNDGQLGNNSTTNSSVPVAVTTAGTALAGKTVIAVAAGQFHSMALCSDGTVVSWGYNANGQLGNNSTTQSNVAVVVPTAGTALAGKTVTGLSAGFYHSVATCSDGTIATWGYNVNGQLGNSSTTQSNVPVAVSTSPLAVGESLMQVAGGQSAYHSLGLVAMPLPPVATTLAATSVTATTAVLNGTVNANGGSAAVSFDYGLDTSYGTNVAGTPATVSGGSGSAVSLSLTGLTSGATYHFRVNGVDSSGTSNGGDQTFTTANANLSGLAISAGSLSPAFSSSVYSYTASVGTAVASMTVTPTTADSNATVTVNGTAVTSGSASSSIALNYGNTTLNIMITASDHVSTQTYALIVTRAVPNPLTASYASGTDIPVTINGFTATGSTVNFALNYAPAAGTQLMLVKNIGLGFINGTFSNLSHGQVVGLSYNGVTYKFVANYYGGTGNDLVLMWAGSRPISWGYNTAGELGNNSTTSSSIPIAITTAGTPLATRTVLAYSAGFEHSLALCSDGTVVSWGLNNNGQLGIGSTTQSNVPVAVTTTGPLAGKVVCAVSTGNLHSLALCTDGTLASWGFNAFGQLGNNSTTSSNVPVAVTTVGTPLAGKTVIAIGAGIYHSVAVCSDGTIVTWGFNTYGQLGNSTTTNSKVPVAVTTAGTLLAGKSVVSVVAGGYHNLALCSDGTLVTWGENNNGQLGNNSTTNSSVPVAVTTAGTALAGKTVVSMAAGNVHSVVLCSDGSIATWGNNTNGQLGNNSTTQSNVAVAVTTAGTALAGKTVTGLTSGFYHSVATCSDNSVATWGYNVNGQLGNNSTTQSNVPVAVSTSPLAAGESFMLIAGGQSAYHALGLVATPVPAATTLAATSVTTTTAVLNGTVNANGGSAAVSFDYGLDTTYGTNVAGTPATVTGSSSTAVSVSLTGLTPGTTYHFRVNGAGGSGTASGADMTFTTSDSNANLSGLSLSAGTLSPAFGSSVLAYAVAMPNATTSFTVTPAAASSGATIVVNGTAVASGTASAPVTLSGDSMTVNVVVTAQDGTTVKTYALNISRNTAYQDWTLASNLSGTNNSLTADSDGDGIPNLLEYAFNANPNGADKNILPISANSFNPADNKHYFTYTYRRLIVPGTMTYSIESSANLGSWSAVTAQNLQQVGTATGTGDGVSEVVTFRLLPALEDGPPANFVRLKVTP